jgi:hypothetical protein
MRVLRRLKNESLDRLGASIGGVEKSTLSSVERYPNQAGPRLRKRLEKHYDCPWSILSSEVTGDVVATALLKTLTAKKVNPAHA